jgi:imidazolonepropionase
MRQLVYRNISCLITNEGIVKKAGIKPQESDLGIISAAAIAWHPTKGILWAGKNSSLPKEFKKKSWRHLDCKGLTAYPGLVDAHTHPVFSGDRSREFELRMQGAGYQAIAEAGGGISNTMQNTRKSSKASLTKNLLTRLEQAKKFGVRLLEAKSGYGLNFDSEIRSLEAIQLAKTKIRDLEIVSTCLSAHAIPPEYKFSREKYITLIKEKILPTIQKKRLAEYVDVFCDAGYFTVPETLDIIQTAKKLGLHFRLHGEELAHTGIAEAGSEAGAHSIDHLLKIDQKGIDSMAKFGTTAILLPATSFYLKTNPAPARALINAGVVVALATDFNPGTSPTQNLPFVGTLAAIELGMTSAEIITGLTWAGAKSLRREKKYGATLPGYLGKPSFSEGDHPSALFYKLAQSDLPDPEIFAL